MPHSTDRRFHLFLLVTTALCGAMIMVVEVLGSRVIGPFFGVSLFVWTALIAVTLVALAAGYACGGWLADRHGTPTVLYGLIALSGVLVTLIPWLKGPVLEGAMNLGLRGGALFAATILFGPPLLVLGFVSPLVVRLATVNLGRLGRVVGSLYALSTIGSVIGTILAGFYLIALFGVDRIFLLVGLVLLALALVYFTVFNRRPAAIALLALAAVPVIVGLYATRQEYPEYVLGDGTRVRLVDRQQSHYGDVRVVEYRFGEVATRELLIDGLVQGGIDLATGESIYEYAYGLASIPSALNPDAERALVVGLGAGLVPARLRESGIDVEVVEIDPAVIGVAERHFGYDASIPTHIGDARHFLRTAEDRFDIIVVDVFNGDITPAHLMSLEAMAEIARLMAPRAVLAMNLVGRLEASDEMTASIAATVSSVFGEVRFHPVFDLAESTSGNFLLVARKESDLPYPAGVVLPDPRSRLVNRQLIEAMTTPMSIAATADARLLTDNYNPADLLDLDLREQVRRNILATTHPGILIR